MKKLVLLLALLPCVLIAQEPDSTQIVYEFIDIEPQFPGGPGAMNVWLVQNIVYPNQARMNGEEGIVWLKFVVAANGNIENITVVRGVSELLDAEAVRVVSTMPTWIPAELNGQPVAVNFNLPLKFILG